MSSKSTVVIEDGERYYVAKRNKGYSEEFTIYCSDKNLSIIHRSNGPAIEYTYISYKAWYRYGKRHREDGPAEEWDNGRGVRYYLNGVLYSKEKYWSKIKFGGFS